LIVRFAERESLGGADRLGALRLQGLDERDHLWGGGALVLDRGGDGLLRAGRVTASLALDPEDAGPGIEALAAVLAGARELRGHGLAGLRGLVAVAVPAAARGLLGARGRQVAREAGADALGARPVAVGGRLQVGLERGHDARPLDRGGGALAGGHRAP